MLPEIDGQALYQRLKTRHASLKVLFMSGYSGHAAVNREVLRPSVFLQKPFEPEALVQKVNTFFADA